MRTFVILKPETLELGLVGKIITRFEDAGFKSTKMLMRPVTPTWLSSHYAHVAEDVFKSIQMCMRGSMLGIVLEGFQAVARVRKMVGYTFPECASVGTIRFDFGRHEAPRNIIHASDDSVAVDREIELFFGEVPL
jgi:nucleoside-diphosphate kinase